MQVGMRVFAAVLRWSQAYRRPGDLPVAPPRRVTVKLRMETGVEVELAGMIEEGGMQIFPGDHFAISIKRLTPEDVEKREKRLRDGRSGLCR